MIVCINGFESTYQHTELLLHLDALSNVSRVTNDVRIRRNDALEDIGGLFGLSMVGRDFQVVDNPSLPTGMVESLAYEVLGDHGVGGEVIILGNLDG